MNILLLFTDKWEIDIQNWLIYIFFKKKSSAYILALILIRIH